MENIYNMGVEFGKITKTTKNQRMELLKLLEYKKRNDFIEKILLIAVGNQIQIPDILIDDKENFYTNATSFLMGVQNGSLEK